MKYSFNRPPCVLVDNYYRSDRTLKYKTPTPDAPANVSIQASNVSSIMTSMTDSTADQSTDNPLVHHTETSIDSVAVKLKCKIISFSLFQWWTGYQCEICN